MGPFAWSEGSEEVCKLTTILAALLTGAVFSLSSLLALLGGRITQRSRSYATAIAAAILLALAFGDLFPASLDMVGNTAVFGFIGGFSLLFLVETFTRAHTYHLPEEDMHQHAVTPFVVGLTVHNFADGLAIGISSQMAGAPSWLLALGVAIHQVPVGFSMAAVFATAHATRTQTIRTSILLSLVIPVSAILTLALPDLVEQFSGLLLSIAGGLLAYVATAHLLPEAQAEHPSRAIGMVFVLAMLVMVTMLTLYGE